jgi:hypothetical protein
VDTIDLINGAVNLRAALETAKQNLQTTIAQAQTAIQTATDAVNQAQADSTAADQALHDDLLPPPDGGGPALVLDLTVEPPTAVMYTAVDPDSWTVTPIRVAG